MKVTEIIIFIAIGLAAGMLSGMFGVGGGIIIVPALVLFAGMSQHTAQGTSLGLMLFPIGILAAWNYYKAGHLDIKAGLLIAAAFVIGGYLGSKLSLTINQLTLKRIFGALMLIVAIRLIFFSK
ncbi:sulfite exporter TauE/SafE family protein [Salibacter sp.]|uniref:sulfite exporter TauE/SafE family protein n=1 Tax=Salibacter sp. TaxID=2010995 RepID=UPI00286FBA4A|nr:sulfite exporter TauE/SafE family protein [Salibacter sp.]MDR9487461.1 sulfite exporter TauE/SafE family protein [Salibacter sp.]